MNDNPVPAGILARKLAAILREVGKAPKSGHNSFHNYDYVTENDLVYAVRDKLAAAEIFVFTSVEKQEVQIIRDDTDPARVKQSVLTQVTTKHTFVDGESGESFSVFSQGQGSDVGDKGGYKATTGAMKYFLYKCFMIPTGDDPEADSKTDERGADAGHQRQQANPPPASRSASVPRDAQPAGLPKGTRWEDVTIHFGKNKGKKLGDLEDKVISWYADSWEINPKYQGPQDDLLKAAVAAWADEQAQK